MFQLKILNTNFVNKSACIQLNIRGPLSVKQRLSKKYRSRNSRIYKISWHTARINGLFYPLILGQCNPERLLSLSLSFFFLYHSKPACTQPPLSLSYSINAIACSQTMLGVGKNTCKLLASIHICTFFFTISCTIGLTGLTYILHLSYGL